MKHLDEVNETYFEHLRNALIMCFFLQLAVLVIFIHAFFPALFAKEGSSLANKAIQIRDQKSDRRL